MDNQVKLTHLMQLMYSFLNTKSCYLIDDLDVLLDVSRRKPKFIDNIDFIN